MLKPLLIALSCSLLVSAVPIGQQPRFQRTRAGQKVTLSREEQQMKWHPLSDKKLNSKGFTAWKPTKAGFLLQNSDFQVACFADHIGGKVSCGQPMPQTVIDLMKNKHDSFLERRSQQKARARVFTAIAMSKAATTVDDSYTPHMEKNLLALNPTLSYEHENDSTGSSTWSRKYDLNDGDNEGEVDNSDLDIEAESELDTGMMRRMLDHVDVGPGQSLDEENERDTQAVTTRKATLNSDPSKKKWSALHSDIGRRNNRAGLVDVPYVDAGIDRVVNERMFQFFKKHPQYHTPKAYHLTAERWQRWMAMSGDESDVMGGGAAPVGMGGGEKTAMGQTGAGVGIWKTSCPETVTKGWPDTPRPMCQHYAVSPLGFWGCKSLFEDGTCTQVEFYKDMKWDGLDAYPMPKKNPDAPEGEQYTNPAHYHDEKLPGGNAVNHDYYTL
mmetsp:Transcript_20933/g.41494  ORF Transcript_20933/g.41494 Transcript_20933/m.41494 type:complete len:441 (+) Transcript_20933:38-1360(+)|eukprot:CAMPEP_0175129970 /NCGR_PEP_ID=MMETSP0087-20121206/5759_1 /TAXON_ID=136419 /ORGANISM="Unknown Unknown, Strain D1" /LENGTH=440 /DNA_ID=CAMNT_0016412161 /DNA_START=38 /DNA_END=1360 /DNA_ORIENTATION=+